MATKHKINLKVNGKDISSEVDSRQLLIHFLRDQLNLTGSHVGCDTGSCGACSVIVNGDALKACNLLAVQVDGAEITTIEGLSQNGELHPLQEAFNSEHGLQCGFCTPGMIVASWELLKQNPNPSNEEIRHKLEGNYCRCTGYENIVRSVKNAAGKMQTA